MPIDALAGLLFLSDRQNKAADIIHIKCKAGFTPDQTVEVVRKIWTEFASQQLEWPAYYVADTEIVTAIEKQAQYAAELRKQMGVLLLIFGIISAGVIILVFCIF